MENKNILTAHNKVLPKTLVATLTGNRATLKHLPLTRQFLKLSETDSKILQNYMA
jgi:hypothetical protein